MGGVFLANLLAPGLAILFHAWPNILGIRARQLSNTPASARLVCFLFRRPRTGLALVYIFGAFPRRYRLASSRGLDSRHIAHKTG